MESIKRIINLLENLNIPYTLFRHPELPTIEDVLKFWTDLPGEHCKNLFFRNHKGNRHYLVLIRCTKQLNIHNLEQNLKQGKLTFASNDRLFRYLGLLPGSVSPFGLINDTGHHVKLFIDNDLQNSGQICFHPNDNTASIMIQWKDFIRFLDYCGNEYEFF